MHFASCFIYFFFFIQCGIFSGVFLYAGANPAYNNTTTQEKQVHFAVLRDSTYIQKEWKISIAMINDPQFLERMYETDFFLAPPTKT